MRQKKIKSKKKLVIFVWACLKGTIQEKTIKEKSTLKKNYNDKLQSILQVAPIVDILIFETISRSKLYLTSRQTYVTVTKNKKHLETTYETQLYLFDWHSTQES